MAFWGALGSALANYGMSKLEKHKLGQAGVDAYNQFQNQQPDPALAEIDRTIARPADPNAALSDAIQGAPPAGSPSPVPEAMGEGKIVTSPTLAMVGDKGPEAVVPLTSAPGQKISATMLGGSARTRYGRVRGPNSLAHQAPMYQSLPLIPNKTVR